MSTYHLMRNFVALLRTMGYPRFVSLENFRKPNFVLMADIVVFLLKRFDSFLEINASVESEQERLNFVRTVSHLMVSKAHLDVNIKRLYMADVNAVQEVFKLANLIQKAWISLDKQSLVVEEDGTEGVTNVELPVFDRSVHNSFKTNQLTSDILQLGTELYDVLADYDKSKEQRQATLSKQLVIEQVESSIRQSITELQQQIVDQQNRKETLDQDNEDLNGKIEKKQAELNRNRKRMQTLYAQRPGYMDELEKVEQEIISLYDTYVVNSRCLFFLDQKLEEFEELERLKIEERNEEIKQMLEQMGVDEFLKEGKNIKLSAMDAGRVNNDSDELAMMVDVDEDEFDEVGGPDLSDSGPTGNESSGRKSRQKASGQRRMRSEKKSRSLMANTVLVKSRSPGSEAQPVDEQQQANSEESMPARSAKTARIYSFGSLLENYDDDDDDDESRSDARLTDSEIDLDAIDDSDSDESDSDLKIKPVNTDRPAQMTNGHAVKLQSQFSASESATLVDDNF